MLTENGKKLTKRIVLVTLALLAAVFAFRGLGSLKRNSDHREAAVAAKAALSQAGYTGIQEVGRSYYHYNKKKPGTPDSTWQLTFKAKNGLSNTYNRLSVTCEKTGQNYKVFFPKPTKKAP